MHIKSRCKITAFFAIKCAYIPKKCVKIDAFGQNLSTFAQIICVYKKKVVYLHDFLKITLKLTNNLYFGI